MNQLDCRVVKKIMWVIVGILYIILIKCFVMSEFGLDVFSGVPPELKAVADF